MCKRLVAGLLILVSALCNKAGAQQYAFQITFTNKNNTPYTLSDPAAYLSARAIARRATQGISIDSTDLPVNATYIDSVLTLTGGKFHCTSRWLNMLMILLEQPDSAEILNLAGKSFISDVQLVGVYDYDLHRTAHTAGGNPMTATARTTTADNIYYGNTWPQTTLVNGNYLHDLGYNGSGKMIAVLDAGYIGADTHPGFDSLRNDGRLVDQYNFVTDNTDVFISDDHGAEVLSTMAGYVPDTFVGTAPLAMYALYVTEIDGTDQPLELDNMVAGAEHADSIGADIITESLGYDLWSAPFSGQAFSELDGKTTVAAQAANFATKKGMLFIATAGNDGSPPIPGWGTHILTPGDADSALTIGAVDYTGTVAAFSGYGPNAAGRIKPDVCAMGESAAVFNTVGGGYATNNGTSFSTPQVAGWAACLWQSYPMATPFEIRQAVIQCASAYSDPANAQLGYGIPNFECTEKALNVLDTPLPFSASRWIFATPDPFSSTFNISVSPAQNGNITFQLFDMQGKKVFSLTDYFQAGYNAPVTISLPGLPSGIYMLRAKSAALEQTFKMRKE